MKFNLNGVIQFLRKYQADIILVIGVILISLLSFAIGFIMAKQQEKEPIKIEREATYEFTNLGFPLRISTNSYSYIRRDS